MSLVVVGLDLSTKTGFAVGRDFERPFFGTWDLGKSDQDGDGARASRLAQALDDLLAASHAQRVIYEAPLARMQTSARLLIGLCLIVEMVCSERAVRYCETPASTARKLVLGRGGFHAAGGKPGESSRLAKAAVKEWCMGNGWTGGDDNANDALLLLRYQHLLLRSTVMAGAGSSRRE